MKKYYWDLTKRKDTSSGVLTNQDCFEFWSREIVLNGFRLSYFHLSFRLAN